MATTTSFCSPRDSTSQADLFIKAHGDVGAVRRGMGDVPRLVAGTGARERLAKGMSPNLPSDASVFSAALLCFSTRI
jgi:hypothetical protein